MAGPDQTETLRKLALGSWILSGVSFVGVVIGIILCVANGSRSNGIFFIAFGGIGVFLGLIVGFVCGQQRKAVAALTKGEGEIWARWTCAPDEAARFVAAEQARLKITSAQRWGIVIGALAFGLLSPFLYVIVRGGTISVLERVLTFAFCIVGGGLMLLLAPGFVAREVKRAAARAAGEIIVSAKGLLAGGTYYPWKSFNWGLQKIAFEPSSPAVIQFDFLAGTIVGSAEIRMAGQLAYALGEVKHVQGRTQQKQQVRIPVPQGKEQEARQIVATLMGVPVTNVPAAASRISEQITSAASAPIVPGPDLTTTNQLSAGSNTMGIYLWKNEQQLGPFEEADIKGRLASGSLSYDDLAWREGMSDWQPLRQIYPEPVAPVAAAPPPSAPPSPALTSSVASAAAPKEPAPSQTKAEEPAAANLATTGIYLWKDNQQLGPFSENDIRDRVAAGTLSVEDLGWREGIADWQPLRQVYPALAAVQVPARSVSVDIPPPLTKAPPVSAAPYVAPAPATPGPPPPIPSAPLPPSVSPPKKSPLKVIASVALGLLVLGLGILKIANVAVGLFKKKTGITQTTGSTQTSTSHASVAEGKKLYENQQYAEALRIFQPAAAKGDSEAQYYLGAMYDNGLGVTKDQRKAAEWYRKAADQGYADAEVSLGYMYEKGIGGLTKNDTEALKWYRKSADKGNPSGQVNLGIMYERGGGGLTKSPADAVKWYRKAADQGNAGGQCALGRMLLYGKGITKNEVEGTSWIRKAAEQGDADGEVSLGWNYIYGFGVTRDFAEAISWLDKAIEQGNAGGQAMKAYLYMNAWGVEQDYAEARDLFQKAADQDDGLGQFGLGYLALYGRGEKEDNNKALTWFKKSAEQEIDDGQYGLGLMYENGWGVEKDYAKALDLFTKADEFGHSEAECQIGIMYAKGWGVTKDYAQALSWFTKAHENRVSIDGSGPTIAEVFLGWMYENGYGVQKNIPRALDWYRLAADRYNAEAKAAIARLTKK